MTLLGVDEIREFIRIADEKHRCVVANQVPVAFLGIEGCRALAVDRPAAPFITRRGATGPRLWLQSPSIRPSRAIGPYTGALIGHCSSIGEAAAGRLSLTCFDCSFKLRHFLVESLTTRDRMTAMSVR